MQKLTKTISETVGERISLETHGIDELEKRLASAEAALARARGETQ